MRIQLISGKYDSVFYVHLLIDILVCNNSTRCNLSWCMRFAIGRRLPKIAVPRIKCIQIVSFTIVILWYTTDRLAPIFIVIPLQFKHNRSVAKGAPVTAVGTASLIPENTHLTNSRASLSPPLFLDRL